MKKALARKKNEKGFTLMEMLIVVAIIAVLVAIMIPAISGSLVKAKEAADVANIRSFYAEQMVEYMDGGTNAAFDVYPESGDGSHPALNYPDKNTTVAETEDKAAYYKYSAAKLNGGTEKELDLYLPSGASVSDNWGK